MRFPFSRKCSFFFAKLLHKSSGHSHFTENVIRQHIISTYIPRAFAPRLAHIFAKTFETTKNVRKNLLKSHVIKISQNGPFLRMLLKSSHFLLKT
jgi:hypothetical protein